MKSTLDEKVTLRLVQNDMLAGAAGVIVALSGGADSMSLLHFLIKNKAALGIEVAAAHLNHNLRGEESRRDERFVRSECERLGVSLYVRSADIASVAKQTGKGIEECGRDQRYAFFAELHASTGFLVATAHTASDNAETLLLNITRGCGIDGLCGIPPVRGWVIRPLLSCTREDVEDYCRENSIGFVTDSTNLCDDYARNKIRLNVLPELRAVNPSVVSSLNRLSALAIADSELIGELSQEELSRCMTPGGLSLQRLKECRQGLLTHVIRRAVEQRFDITPEKKHIDIVLRLINEGSGAVELRKDRLVRVEKGLLKLEDTSANLPMNAIKTVDMPFSPGLMLEYNGRVYVISEKITPDSADDNKINKKLLIERLSCDIISCDTIIRNRRSGDVFSPFGRGCTKTVKKLFSEMKLPRKEREERLLIANGSHVLWIEGVGASQDAAALPGKAYYEVKSGVNSDDRCGI